MPPGFTLLWMLAGILPISLSGSDRLGKHDQCLRIFEKILPLDLALKTYTLSFYFLMLT